MERSLASIEKVCAAVGDVVVRGRRKKPPWLFETDANIVDILRLGDDPGLDTGMLMSRGKYQELVKPRHAILNEYVHKHSGMKTFLHSCGSLYPIIPYLIEAGYDILNPIQTIARDMHSERLKKEFGKDITFWGWWLQHQNNIKPRSSTGSL